VKVQASAVELAVVVVREVAVDVEATQPATSARWVEVEWVVLAMVVEGDLAVHPPVAIAVSYYLSLRSSLLTDRKVAMAAVLLLLMEAEDMEEVTEEAAAATATHLDLAASHPGGNCLKAPLTVLRWSFKYRKQSSHIDNTTYLCRLRPTYSRIIPTHSRLRIPILRFSQGHTSMNSFLLFFHGLSNKLLLDFSDLVPTTMIVFSATRERLLSTCIP